MSLLVNEEHVLFRQSGNARSIRREDSVKRQLRKNFIEKRDSIHPEQKRLKEAAIEKRLFSLNEFRKACSILFYVSFRSEVNTMNYLEDVVSLGKTLILPRVDSRHKSLHLFKVKDVSELSPGYMGILEPEIKKEREINLNKIDLVIIPGTGFDITGSRIGYGGGYYDRLLSYESKQLARVEKHIMTIALAFEEQIGNKIPSEPHDIKVDMIVTEERTIHCT
jgi:5-formyltetrahydrofolate cyclo-ligase